MSATGPRATSHRARVKSRRNALQALYQWDLTHEPIARVISEFETDRSELDKADRAYFRDLLEGVARHREDLEVELGRHLDRALAQLDPVERSVLYLGIYELMFQPELPWRVVVNESVELAKMFGAEQSHRYINAILDAAARRVRAEEIAGIP